MRVLVSFVGLLLGAFVLFHTPPVQNLVTSKTAQYLSRKIGSSVVIEAIQLNFWGGLTVKHIVVKDPANASIFTAKRLHASPSLWHLLFGEINLASVELEGTELDLQKRGDELNIDFIIDAFTGTADQAEQPSNLSIRIDKLILQNISAKYQDLVENTGFRTKLGTFELADFKFSAKHKTIELSEIDLEDSYFLLIYSGKQGKDSINKLPALDFNSGITINASRIHLKNNHLEFHEEKQVSKSVFDEKHLVFDGTELEISDLVVSPELFSSTLDHLATTFAGFSLHRAAAEISISQQELSLLNLLIDFQESQVQSSIRASYPSWENLISEFKNAAIDLSFEGAFNPNNLMVFFPDDISSLIENRPLTQLMISGSSEASGIHLDSITFNSGSDYLALNSKFSPFDSMDSLRWLGLHAQGSIGSLFSGVLTQVFPEITIPEGTDFEINSDGNMHSLSLSGAINSPVGKLTATGAMNGSNLDLAIETEEFNIGSVISQPWLGSTNLDLGIKGNPANSPGLSINGEIHSVTLSHHQVEQISVDALLIEETLEIDAIIDDQNYLSVIEAQVAFADALNITSEIDFDSCLVGNFIGVPGLQVSGNMKSNLRLDTPSIEALMSLSNFEIRRDTIDHLIDSLQLDVQMAEHRSHIEIKSSELSGELLANFNLQQDPLNLKEVFISYGPGKIESISSRKLDFNLLVEEIRPIQIIDPRFENLVDLHLNGHLDESESTLELNLYAKDFRGFGLSLDSIGGHFLENKQLINSEIVLENIEYSDFPVGDLTLHTYEQEEKFYSTLVLTDDTIEITSLTSRIEPLEHGIQLRLDSLSTFGKTLEIDPSNTFEIGKDGIKIENFNAGTGEFGISAEGNPEGYNLKIVNGELRNLNYLLISDSITINQGMIHAQFSYSDKLFDLDFGIHDLVVGNSPPLSITATAKSQESILPFEFKLNSASNQATLSGSYFPNNAGIDAELSLNITELEMFHLLFRDRLERISGKVDGTTKISGTLQEPIYTGALRFQEVDFTTSRPVSTFHLKDEILKLDNQGIVLDEFTIYDQWENPLVLDGVLRTQDYKSFDYDFTLFTENYLLLNNPVDDQYQLQGVLVVGSNLEFQGNEKDTRIDADIVIRDTTALSYLLPEQDLELLSNEGIVEFVDPNNPADTLEMAESESFYDSIMATLPSFNLRSKVVLEEKAVFKVIMNPRSGDFIEAAGTADLNFDVDRTGNVKLNGNYQVTRGFYQLSFYDLVKKRFDLAKGSSVTWDGDPNTGVLDIKAIHSISSSSIGLIGHEIGESERELYRTALPYQVGIIIRGTIEEPQIMFSLELPEDEKTKYPVLANKLERLTQPEFESELNKQVFGLLVLGGFIPDDSGSDLDQSLIATTAISNSVNSILASQLNRFAGQLIKGVDINVGLQSYSDYTSGGSQTRTAMDFRVTKRMMDDRLSIEVGGGMDINSDLSGSNPGSDNFRGDITVIYDLTESGTKKLKLFNNETYDIIYHEIRNTGISLIFIKDFDKGEKAVN